MASAQRLCDERCRIQGSSASGDPGAGGYRCRDTSRFFTRSDILKLFAWVDRKHEKRDAPDILKILADYADAGNEDPLYADELPLLEAAGFDVPIAGAHLVGKDARRIASQETVASIAEILADPNLKQELLNISPTAARGVGQLLRSSFVSSWSISLNLRNHHRLMMMNVSGASIAQPTATAYPAHFTKLNHPALLASSDRRALSNASGNPFAEIIAKREKITVRFLGVPDDLALVVICEAVYVSASSVH